MLKTANSDADLRPLNTECFEVLPGDLKFGLLLLCDHADNQFPPGYGTLGLPTTELCRHIAYDIGAAGVTRGLNARLKVPTVLTRYSRLLIDPNRGVDDPTLIMQVSDGAVIPGNRPLDMHERQKRIELYYEPYHKVIEKLLDRFFAAEITPMVLSIHSFTECWKQTPRPWHITVLWDRDPRLPEALLKRFRAETALIVDENEPYSGQLEGDTLYRHATQRGLAHALLEIRQDLIRDENGQMAWAERIAHVVRDVLSQRELISDLRQVKHYGSNTETNRPSQLHRH